MNNTSVIYEVMAKGNDKKDIMAKELIKLFEEGYTTQRVSLDALAEKQENCHYSYLLSQALHP